MTYVKFPRLSAGGLRAVAGVLAAHPDLPVRSVEATYSGTIEVHPTTGGDLEQVATIGRAFGAGSLRIGYYLAGGITAMAIGEIDGTEIIARTYLHRRDGFAGLLAAVAHLPDELREDDPDAWGQDWIVIPLHERLVTAGELYVEMAQRQG